MNPTGQTATASRAPAPDTIASLLAQFADLVADALAPRLATQLAALQHDQARHAETARLITLDQLIDLLPPTKPRQTWRRWLYERSRHRQIPGAIKLGGTLFFNPTLVLEWLEAGAPTTPRNPTGCLSGTEQQSSRTMRAGAPSRRKPTESGGAS